jgi:hypothetical protein
MKVVVPELWCGQYVDRTVTWIKYANSDGVENRIAAAAVSKIKLLLKARVCPVLSFSTDTCGRGNLTPKDYFRRHDQLVETSERLNS